MASNKKKYKSIEKKQINTLHSNIGNFLFDFSYETAWISVDVDGFTNFLEDSNEFVKKHKKTFDIVREISKIPAQQVESNYKHCNYINKPDAVERIKNILFEQERKLYPTIKKEIINDKIEQLIDSNIYEFGIKQEVRIFGIRTDKVIKVLFVDYFHKVFPSIKYNHLNPNGSFCPHNSD